MSTLKITIKADQEKAEEIIRAGLSKGVSEDEIRAQVVEQCIEIVGPPGVGKSIKVNRKQMINRDGVNMAGDKK